MREEHDSAVSTLPVLSKFLMHCAAVMNKGTEGKEGVCKIGTCAVTHFDS